MRAVLWTISWVPVAITLTQTVGQVAWVQGASMKPSLNPDSSLGSRDLVLLQKWGVKRPGVLSVGDVVVLRSPLDPKKIMIKRVLGLGGHTVGIRPTSQYPRNQVKIPTAHLWVEGDNIHSVDSNEFGPVSTGLVIGKANYIIYPFSRWGPIPVAGREARIPRQ